MTPFVLLLVLIPLPAMTPAAQPRRPDPARPGVHRLATDYPNLQAAIDAFPADRGGALHLPAGTYRVRAPIRIRGRNYGINLVGEGVGSRIVVAADSPDQPILDLTGSSYCSLRHLNIETEGPHRAACGILLARVADKYSAGIHHFEGVSIGGRFTLAPVICLASEANTWTRCSFINLEPGGHGFALLSNARAGDSAAQSRPARDRAAPPGDVDYGRLFALPRGFPECAGGSMLETSFYDCYWNIEGRTGREVALWVEMDTYVGGDLNIFGGGIKAAAADFARRGRGGRAGILLVSRSGGLNHVNVVGCRFETDGARHGIEAWTPPGGSIGHVTISGCTLQALEEVVRAYGNGVTGWHIARNMLLNQARYDWGDASGRALVRLSRAFYCDLDVSTLAFAGMQSPDPVRVARFAIAVDTDAQGNTFTVTDRRLLALGPGDLRGNVIHTINEDGLARRRMSLGAESILNLTPMDAAKVASPRVGDVVLDPQRGLVWWDGSDWKK